ncbi:putative bifunctional diguanylate cyclase/phosphodiesterase [Paenisporosarcina cavernae]|uniref:Phosphodiesterase n=1 Tax=Paenisporosarcina cavernae TaxID=2320858 RepID=A0A385YUD3_9BACL|nr:GGDEF domain-containing phosphodiesterase [Paenisporosarcina cavernae]AYC29073.1 phosphodiesterase [Paenisporosarcina cavernae]
MNYSSTDASDIRDFMHQFATKNPFDMTFILQKSATNEYVVRYFNELAANFSEFTMEESGYASRCFSVDLWTVLKKAIRELPNHQAGLSQKLIVAMEPKLHVFDAKILSIQLDEEEEYIYVSLTDQTHVEAERVSLLETKEKYESILDHNLDPLVSVDESGVILYVNPAVLQSFGYMNHDIEHSTLLDYIDSASKSSFVELMNQSFLGLSVELEECSFLHKNGHYLPVYVKTIPIVVNNLVKGIHVIIRDTSPHVENKEKLFYLSYHDHLTGLWNRRALKEHLREDTRFAELHGEELAVIYIDLDRFKLINDSLGYNAGDDLMKRIADRLNTVAIRNSRVYRHSGDEFVFVVRKADRLLAEQFVKVVLDELNKPFYIEHQEYFISASAGISLFPTDGKEMDVLLKKADQALFYVKDRGRAHFRFFREEMNHSFPNEALMESHLRRAIEMDELYIHYQPQVNLKTGQINSFEALLRWDNKTFGFVPPSQFIPIAEESGLILQLGDWVLEKVCHQLQEWQQKGYHHMRIAVNISPKQFKQETFSFYVESLLAQYQVSPEALEVEITESAMTNMRETLTVLNSLKKIGVVISIDDFGTGYSSLSYLKRYPIDIIKIDQSFIRGIETDEKNAAIAKTIIQLAQNLGMEVIAEGVEKLLQVDILKEANCHKAQGYYFSQPVSMNEVIARYFA